MTTEYDRRTVSTSETDSYTGSSVPGTISSPDAEILKERERQAAYEFKHVVVSDTGNTVVSKPNSTDTGTDNSNEPEAAEHANPAASDPDAVLPDATPADPAVAAATEVSQDISDTAFDGPIELSDKDVELQKLAEDFHRNLTDGFKYEWFGAYNESAAVSQISGIQEEDIGRFRDFYEQRHGTGMLSKHIKQALGDYIGGLDVEEAKTLNKVSAFDAEERVTQLEQAFYGSYGRYKTAGSAAGMISGAAVGAIWGGNIAAALGLPFGGVMAIPAWGVGAAIGGLIGGAIGYFGGYLGGTLGTDEKLAKTALEGLSMEELRKVEAAWNRKYPDTPLREEINNEMDGADERETLDALDKGKFITSKQLRQAEDRAARARQEAKEAREKAEKEAKATEETKIAEEKAAEEARRQAALKAKEEELKKKEDAEKEGSESASAEEPASKDSDSYNLL